MNAIKDWIINHDDRWSFVILYVGGAVLLSVFMSLFWVILLMAGNFALKVYRNYLAAKPMPLLTSLWQVKLDIGLIFFALVIGLYSDHIFGALGLSQAARAGQAVRSLQMVTRFGIIERGLKIFFLTIDDQARLVNAVVKARKKKKLVVDVPPEALPEPESSLPSYPWKFRGKGDIFSLSFGLVCIALLVFAPVILGKPAAETAQHILWQLKP